MLKTALRYTRAPILFLALGALILLGIIAASIWLAVQTARNTEDIRQIRALRTAATEEFETLLDAETGQRGYLLSGRKDYLAPYRAAQKRAHQVLQRLDILAHNDPVMQVRLTELKPVAEEKLRELDSTVELYAAGKHQDAFAVVDTGHGKVLMDSARILLKGIIGATEAELQDRLVALNRSVLMLRALTVVGGFLVALFAGYAIWLMLRSIRDAVRARMTVEELNASLEERVQDRTAALTRANDEIQRFAYIVSHDLRSPLVNVMGFTSELEVGAAALQKYFDSADPADRAAAEIAAKTDLPEALKFIRSSTAKMDRLINAILKLSREGRRELMPERVDLSRVFETIIASLKHQIDATNTVVVVQPDLPVITSDRLAIEQIFGNLLDNALKYLDPSRPGEIKIEAAEYRGYVRITVADNGRGIAEQDAERIFELFRRAGRQDRPGEGIGLAHVRALARRLGGDVTVRSNLGAGSEFRVMLSRQLTKDQSASA